MDPAGKVQKHTVLVPITPGAKRAVITLFVLVIFLFVINLLFTARQVNQNLNNSRAQCGFYSDLADLPLTVNPATKKAPILGVKIISHSRQSWEGLKCPGKLPPASPSFIKWARYYHLPIS